MPRGLVLIGCPRFEISSQFTGGDIAVSIEVTFTLIQGLQQVTGKPAKALWTAVQDLLVFVTGGQELTGYATGDLLDIMWMVLRYTRSSLVREQAPETGIQNEQLVLGNAQLVRLSAQDIHRKQ